MSLPDRLVCPACGSFLLEFVQNRESRIVMPCRSRNCKKTVVVEGYDVSILDTRKFGLDKPRTIRMMTANREG